MVTGLVVYSLELTHCGNKVSHTMYIDTGQINTTTKEVVAILLYVHITLFSKYTVPA